MSDRLRTAVIGAGWWSTHAHLPTLTEDPRSRLVAVCDQDPERARTAAEAFGVPAVTEVSELLGEVDAAVVATPQGAHHPPAAALLDAGVDTLVEKPLTTDPAEAWDLVRRAECSGARLHVGHTFPYHPAVQEARKHLCAGTPGPALLATGLFSSAVGHLYRGETEPARIHTGALAAPMASTYAAPATGGHLYSQLSHAIAVLLHVLDEPAVRVAALENRAGRLVDVADGLVMSLASGTVVTVAGTGTVPAHEDRVEEYRLFGEEGSLLLDTSAGTLEVRVPGREARHALGELDLSRLPVRQLLAAARGAKVLAPGCLGARVVDVLAAARSSARLGGTAVEIEEST